MPKIDVNKKRGYEASIPIEKYWDKFEKDLNKSFHIPIGETKEKKCRSINLKRNLHILVGGGALSGVGMFRRVTLATLLKFNKPKDLQFILIDSLKISFFYFKNIDKYLALPIVRENKDVATALSWAREEMVRRYEALMKNHTRNIDGYNKKNPSKKIPRIVIIITELGEIMEFNKKETKRLLVDLLQMARPVGIHLIITTQRPNFLRTIPLVIANMPTRIAFKTGDKSGSLAILDRRGAEKLLGQGDMLVWYRNVKEPERMQGYCLEEE